MSARRQQLVNPFPGLRPFRSDEHHLFFGREEQTSSLLQLLRKNRFLAVVGTSGSGKSSLVRAGMIAELHGGTMTRAGSTWEVMILRPGGSPIENLARAMVEADLYDAEDPGSLPRLKATLSRSRYGLVEAMKQSDVFEEGTNLLVVVDQFEELFRFRQQGVDSEETAAAFVNLLLTASEQAECPIYVAITMRSDYLGDCSEIPGLAEAVNDGEYLIPRLMRDQKRDAIEKPVGVGGAKISPLLVQRLLNDVGDDPDQLPVLQHALMRTWDAWTKRGEPDRPIEQADFEATGGLASALSNHADEIYDAFPDDAHRAACEKIFKTLTEKGSDNRGIRRPTRLADLQAIAFSDRDTVVEVLDAFREAGVTFLMPGSEVELTDRTVVDLSHESLMRCWQRLRGWVEEEAQSARIFRRLLDTARLWRDDKAGLFRDPDLQIAISWRDEEKPNAEWAEQYGGNFDEAIGFLDQSNADAEAELQAKEASRQRELDQARQLAEAKQLQLEHQQRTSGKLRKLIAGVAAVALVAGIACVVAMVANERAKRLAVVASQEAFKARESADEAERAQRETEFAMTQVAAEKKRAEDNLLKAELAEKRSREFRYSTDIELAARMLKDPTANATQVTDRLADFDPQNNRELANADDLRGFEWYYLKKLVDSRASVFSGFNKPVVSAAVTQEGALVTLDTDAQVRRFDVATKQEQAAPIDLKKGRTIGSLALSQDGLHVAIVVGNQVEIMNAISGEAVGRPLPTQVRGGLIFSPDSKMLITMDTGVAWWDTATGNPIAVQDFALTVFNSSLPQPLSTSADGLTLAVGGQGTYRSSFSVFKLDPESRGITRVLDTVGDRGTKRTLAVSPDGETVAVSLFFQGGIYFYETATGKLIHSELSAHAAAISAMIFQEEGSELITASLDGAIKVWKDYRKFDSTDSVTLIGHAEEVSAIAVAKSDKQLLSSSKDKTVRIWSLGQDTTDLHQKLAVSSRYRSRFSPDGMLIASSGTDNRLQIWDALTGQPVVQMTEGVDQSLSADSVAFSPDGRFLAAGYGGRQDVSYIELWDIGQRERVAVLPGSTAIPGFTTDENSGVIAGLAFSPDGKHLVAAFGSMQLLGRGDGGDFPLLVYDVATRQVIRRLNGHRNYCVAIAFSDDGSRMASASYDATARIWDAATWQELQVLDNPDSATDVGGRRVYDVAFSPDGELLAIASAEGSVIIFDVASGEVRRTLKGHANEVWGVSFAPDGLTLASASIDGTIRFWNTATWRELLRLEPENDFAPRSISFSSDGDRLLSSDGDGLFLWSAQRDGATSRPIARWLAPWLESKDEFQHRIRMLSDNPGLPEALELLLRQHPNRAETQTALAATRANQYAEQGQWGLAAEEFDRLKLLSVEAPQDWLRTPALLRLATALFRQGRVVEAASLLVGGETRRAEDGSGTRSDSFGFAFDTDTYPPTLTQVFRGSSAWDGGLRVGDLLLKLNNIDVTQENLSAYREAMQGGRDSKLSITFQHAAGDQPQTVEIVSSNHIQDDLTAELIEKLAQSLDQSLATSADPTGLLELRAELAGLDSEFDRQVVDYTAAIDALEAVDPKPTANLSRLYARRGMAYAGLRQWQSSLDDFALGALDDAADEALQGSRAQAQSEVMLSSLSTVLEPQELTSQGGATLTVQDDGSILASGTNPERDVYTLVFRPGLKRITNVVLEALPDPSLPAGGPGRFSNSPGTGNFHVNELRVVAGGEIIPLRDVMVSHGEDGNNGSMAVIDGLLDDQRGWSIYPRSGMAHSLIALLDLEREIDDELKIELHFSRARWTLHNLGRFRLTVINNDSPADSGRFRNLLASLQVDDPWQKLAGAYFLTGDQAAVDNLIKQRPKSAGPIGDLFIEGQDKDWQHAIEIYSQGIGPETTDAELFAKRARAYEEVKQWDLAASDWERAAQLSHGDARNLIDFAKRLADADQSALAVDALSRARTLLDKTLRADPEHVVATEQLADLLLDRNQSLRVGLASLDSDALKKITAIRIDSSSVASPTAGQSPEFTEYQILSARLPNQMLRGRYVRLDLPGVNSRYPRYENDEDSKFINLSELQVFQGDRNIALNKKATASSGDGNYSPDRAVDGNTSGNDVTRSYAHTWDRINPWWEVDLGSEQTFDRIVVWNRSDVRLYPRMNHFRIQVLDDNRDLLYERVIDSAPAPSTEIRRELRWSQQAGADGSEQSGAIQLTLDLNSESTPSTQFRVSTTAEALAAASTDRADDAGWFEIPNALSSQSTASLTLDPQTLAKIELQRKLAKAIKIADAPTRLAAAYELNGEAAAAVDQFRRALNQARSDKSREPVLNELSNYPQSLALLMKQRPDDIELQLALARRHVALGQEKFAGEELDAALTEFQRGREIFDRLLARHQEQQWKVLQPIEMQSEGGALLTVQQDGSVLASGENPGEDTYRVSAGTDLQRITALRLEALPDPSLPKNGPGRSESNGNFHLNEMRFISGDAPVELTDIAVTFDERGEYRDVIDGRVDRSIGWSINSKAGQRSVAVFAVEPLTRPNLPLKFELYLSRSLHLNHALGRFRLSATDDPDAFRSARLGMMLPATELAELDVAIGMSFANKGMVQEAVIAFARALERFEEGDERQAVIDKLKAFPTELSLLAEHRAEDTTLRLALAKRLAENGRMALGGDREEEALGELARAGELFARLAAEHPESDWTMLEPSEMTSLGGADLNLESDGSIFVTGADPDYDAYTIVAPIPIGTIAAVRLETIPDGRFPGGGAGRWGDGTDGDFALADFKVSLNGSAPGDGQLLAIAETYADYFHAGNSVSYAIDFDQASVWSVYTQQSVPHAALFVLREPLVVDSDDQRLGVRLQFGFPGVPRRNLGRFRLSVTGDEKALRVARFQDELKASGLAELETSLGHSHARQGRVDEAAATFARALDLATDRYARTVLIGDADRHEGLLSKLAELKTGDARFLDALTRHYLSRKEALLAHDAAAKARSLYESQLAGQPTNAQLAGELADLLVAGGPMELSVLRPVDLKSSAGAALQLLDDGSILASRTNAGGDVYTLEFDGDHEIAVVRLEAIPDESLPNSGPGRHSSGNFQLSAFRLFRSGGDATEEDRSPIPLKTATASFAYSAHDADVAGTIDDTLNKVWHVWGRVGATHTADFMLQNPVKLRDGEKLVVKLEHRRLGSEGINLGRFRLLATSDPLFMSAQAAPEIDTGSSASAFARLAAAYYSRGESDKAFTTLATAWESASTESAKVLLAGEIAPYPDHLSKLLAQYQDDRTLRQGRARYEGKRLIDAGEIPDGIQVLSTALETAPGDLVLLNHRAAALVQLHQWPAAIADYNRIVELETDPQKRLLARRAVAEGQLRLGQFTAATDSYFQQMMLASDPWRISDAASAAILAGQHGLARTAATRFLETSGETRDQELARWLLRAWVALPELITKENSEKLLAAAPVAGSPMTEPLTAAIHYRLGNLELAEPLLTSAQGDVQYEALAAMLLFDQGNADDARARLRNTAAWFDTARSEDPDSVVPGPQDWHMWAMNLSVWREATRKLGGPRLVELDSLLAEQPDSTAELLQRARLLTDVGLCEEALTDLDRLAALSVDSLQTRTIRGLVLARLNRADDALPLLDQVIAEGFEDADVFVARATLHLKRGETDQALADMGRSLTLRPTASAASELGDLFAAQGEWNRAIEYYQQAVEIQPTDANWIAKRAEAHGKLNQWVEADADWSRVFELKAESESLRQRWDDSLSEGQRWSEVASYFLDALDKLDGNRAWWAPRNRRLNDIIDREDGVFQAMSELRPEDTLLQVAHARHAVLRSDWGTAASLYPQEIDPAATPDEWFETAAAFFLAERTDEYQAYVKRLFESQSKANDDPLVGYALGRSAAISAQEIVPWADVVARAEGAALQDSQAWFLHVAGLAHLRAGNLAKASERLNGSLATGWQPTLGQIANCLLQFQQGNPESARESYRSARTWLETEAYKESGQRYLASTDWLEFHVLLREAQQLIEAIDARE